MTRERDMKRIEEALHLAGDILVDHSHGPQQIEYKADGQPVTAADLAADNALREMLPEAGDAWLSEETVDDPSRMKHERVWIVDPLDGTREFISGVPEWSVSIGLVEDGEPVAGGICNPLSKIMVTGAFESGVFLNGAPCSASPLQSLDGATILASRSETKRGEWDRFNDEPFKIRTMGSVAYKLALVACGHYDATWTLIPKSEWDVAAGVALINAAGGSAWMPNGKARQFNQADVRLPGLISAPGGLRSEIRALLEGG
jgi:myo-inositol-1(or 4)-monophosphatase